MILGRISIRSTPWKLTDIKGSSLSKQTRHIRISSILVLAKATSYKTKALSIGCCGKIKQDLELQNNLLENLTAWTLWAEDWRFRDVHRGIWGNSCLRQNGRKTEEGKRSPTQVIRFVSDGWRRVSYAGINLKNWNNLQPSSPAIDQQPIRLQRWYSHQWKFQ